MLEREVNFAPETEPLGSQETLLFPSPHVLFIRSHLAGLEAVGQECFDTGEPVIVEGYILPGSLTEAVIGEGQKLLDSGDTYARSVYKKRCDTVRREYYDLLDALTQIVGREKIALVTHETVAPPGFRHIVRDIREEEDRLSTLHHLFSFHWDEGGFAVHPRDMASNIGSQMFVREECLPGLEETDEIVRSSLAEGGRVLQAGTSVLISNHIKQDTFLHKDVESLKAQGYKLAVFPETWVGAQPKGKRAFVVEHIDGHASLIVGADERAYLLYAKSFAHQDDITEQQILKAAEEVEAIAVEIDDTHLPHLAFNFLQMRNGTIVLSKTGRKIVDAYEPSELERKLIEIVGEDKIALVPPFPFYARLGMAGLRCLTNIVPTGFLERAKYD